MSQVTNKEPINKTDSPRKEPRVRRQLPPPGKPMNFEEALETGMKRYDNVLRELAK